MKTLSWTQQECLRVIAESEGPCLVRHRLQPLGLHRFPTVISLVRLGLIRFTPQVIDRRSWAAYSITDAGRLHMATARPA